MPFLTRFSGRRECLDCGVHTYDPGACRNCGGLTLPTVECVGEHRPPPDRPFGRRVLTPESRRPA